MERQINFIGKVVLWRDKVNGNTYHSVEIIRTSDGDSIHCPFTYGDGEHYRVTALQRMTECGWIPATDGRGIRTYERENNYPIFWIVSSGTKRECIDNGNWNVAGKTRGCTRKRPTFTKTSKTCSASPWEQAVPELPGKKGTRP